MNKLNQRNSISKQAKTADIQKLVKINLAKWKPELTKPSNDFSINPEATIVGFPNTKVSKTIIDLTNKLKKVQPNHTYHNANDLHLTFLGQFDSNNKAILNKKNLEKLFQKYTLDFSIRGIWAKDSGLGLVCVPQFDIAMLRSEIRALAKEHGSNYNKLAEKLAWISLLRFSEIPNEKFVDTVKHNLINEIGEFTIKKIDVYRIENFFFKRDKNSQNLLSFNL